MSRTCSKHVYQVIKDLTNVQLSRAGFWVFIWLIGFCFIGGLELVLFTIIEAIFLTLLIPQKTHATLRIITRL